MSFSETSYGKNRSKAINPKGGIKNPSDGFKLEKNDFKPLMDSLKDVMNERISRLSGSKILNTNNFNFVDVNVARFLYKKHENLFKEILKDKNVFTEFGNQLQQLIDDIFSKNNLSKFSEENIKQLEDIVLRIVQDVYGDNSTTIKSSDIEFPKIHVTKEQVKGVAQLTQTYQIKKKSFLKILKKQIFKYTEKYFDDLNVDNDIKKEISWKISDIFKTEIEKQDELRRKQTHWTLKEWRKKNEEFKKQIEKNIGIREKQQKKIDNRETTLKEAFRKDIVNNAQLGKNQSHYLRDMVFLKVKHRTQEFNKKLKKTLDSTIKFGKNASKKLKTSYNIMKDLNKTFFGIFSGNNKKDNLKKFLSQTLRLGSLTSIFVLKTSLKGLSILSKGFFLILGPVFKGLLFATKMVFGVVTGTFSIVKNTFIGFKNKAIGLYRFIKNNLFSKRLLRFLKSDIGAMFLGAVCALFKNFVINPILKLFEPIGYDIDDFERTGLEKFLNRNQNIAYLYDKTRNSYYDIRDSFRNMNLDLLPSLDKLLDFAYGMYNLGSSMYDVLKLVAKYRFTSLALKSMKIKGNFIMQLIGVGAGLALDLIFNSSSGHKKDEEKQNNVIMGIDIETLSKGTTSRFTSANVAHKKIREFYKGDNDKMEKALNQYDALYYSIQDEENEIDDLNIVLTTLENGTKRRLTDNYASGAILNLFNKFRKSNLMGQSSIVPGTETFPENFSYWTRKSQLEFFKGIVAYRQNRLGKLKERIEQFGNRKLENDKSILGFLNEVIKEQNEENNSTKMKNFGIVLRKPNVDSKQLSNTLPTIKEYHSTFSGSNIQKIAKFQSMADSISTILTSSGKMGEARAQILSEHIRDLTSKMSVGDVESLKVLDSVMSAEKPEEAMQKLRDHLKSELDKQYKHEQDKKRQYEKEGRRYEGIANLSEEELYQNNVVIPVEKWNEIVTKTQELVNKESGYTEWQNKKEKERKEAVYESSKGKSVWGG